MPRPPAQSDGRARRRIAAASQDVSRTILAPSLRIHSDAFVLTGATDYEEYCMQRMIDSAIEKRWNERTETPYAYFRDAQGELNRLDYDDGRSLGLKYRLAEAAGAAGVAMWTANGVGDAKAPSAAQFWRGIPRVSAQLKTDDASVVPVSVNRDHRHHAWCVRVRVSEGRV